MPVSTKLNGGAGHAFDKQVSVRFSVPGQYVVDGDGIEKRKQFTCACSCAFFFVWIFSCFNFSALTLMLVAPGDVETSVYSAERSDAPLSLSQLGWNIGDYYGKAHCTAAQQCEHQVEVHTEIGIESIRGTVWSHRDFFGTQVNEKWYDGDAVVKWADICPELEKAAGHELLICGSRRSLIYMILAFGALFASLATLIAFTSIYCQLLIWIRLGAVLSFLSGVCAMIGVGLWPGMMSEVMDEGGGCYAIMHLGIYAALSKDPYYNLNNTFSDTWVLIGDKIERRRTGIPEESINVYEHTPRCANGLVFYFGIIVAVLSMCQVCCFIGGNSPVSSSATLFSFRFSLAHCFLVSYPRSRLMTRIPTMRMKATASKVSKWTTSATRSSPVG
jgi:hypothetical protein